MKDKVYMEVHETVSPYAKMMEALKKYIDEISSLGLVFVDELPEEGNKERVYVVTPDGAAYIWSDGWVELDEKIEQINVNGVEQEIIDRIVDIFVPTKTSELENDSDYTTTEAMKKEIAAQIAEIVAGAPESLDTLKEIADWIEGHAKDAAEMNSQIKQNAEDIEALRDLIGELPASASSIVEYIEEVVPTKTSQLTNDSGYITDEALEDYATKEEVEAVEDAAITGINVNGTPAQITDHIADIEVSSGYSITYDESTEALIFG